MSAPIFTINQRKAMELLGYKHWLLRERLLDYKYTQADDSAGQNKADDQALATHSQTVTKKQLLSTAPTIAPAKPSEETSDTLIQETPKAVSHFHIAGIEIVVDRKMTLLSWQDESTQIPMVMVLPPLWGGDKQLQLFANESESQLLITALRACKLAPIADKIGLVIEYLQQQDLTMTQSNEANFAQYINAKSMIIVVNASLPTMNEFIGNLSDALQDNIMPLIHPYLCLQEPKMKAKLWQQLINLQGKLAYD